MGYLYAKPTWITCPWVDDDLRLTKRSTIGQGLHVDTADHADRPSEDHGIGKESP